MALKSMIGMVDSMAAWIPVNNLICENGKSLLVILSKMSCWSINIRSLTFIRVCKIQETSYRELVRRLTLITFALEIFFPRARFFFLALEFLALFATFSLIFFSTFSTTGLSRHRLIPARRGNMTDLSTIGPSFRWEMIKSWRNYESLYRSIYDRSILNKNT